MVPVATERLIVSHHTPSGELTDEELEEEEVAPAWAADVLQFPSSLELDIRVRKGAEPLGNYQHTSICSVFVTLNVTYIPGEAAAAYRKSLQDSGTPPAVAAPQISPSSPYIQQESEKVPDVVPSKEPSETVCDVVVAGVTTSFEVPAQTVEDSIVSVPSSKIDSINEQSALTSKPTTPSETKLPPDSAMTVMQGTVASSPSSVLLAKHWGPERLVEILREPNCSLGISIVGGKVDLYNAGPDSGSAISGIFIKNVLPQSPAGRTGELKTGDRILEVDGIDLRQASHERAVEVIRGAGNPVRFLVQSLIQWSVDGDVESHTTEVASASSAGAAGDSRQPSTTPSPTRELLRTTPACVPLAQTPSPELIQVRLKDEPASPQYSSSEVSDEEDEDEDIRDLEGRTYTKMGREIYRASAGNMKRSKEETEADQEDEDEFGYTT
ncbi:hypothetical protein Cfor_01705, partial [Coptotermes formosanus]